MPARMSLAGLNCSLAHALDLVGDWWTLLIVRDLFIGATRFGQMQKSLGIARNILAARLDQLTRNGIVERGGTGRRPVYRLTEKGRDLFPALAGLMLWGDKWASPEGPPMFITDAAGEKAVAVSVRTRTGLSIDQESARFAPGPGALPMTRAYIRVLNAEKESGQGKEPGTK